MRACLIVAFAFAAITTLACANDASAPPDEGRVRLANDEGVDFSTGYVQEPGNFANSDLFATANGDSGMKLSTGGPSPVENRPVTWFRSGGGIHQQFPDLASVPTSPAPTTSDDAMLNAKLGNGFLLEADDGGLVRGWIAAASPTSVTIEWERVFSP